VWWGALVVATPQRLAVERLLQEGSGADDEPASLVLLAAVEAEQMAEGSWGRRGLVWAPRTGRRLLSWRLLACPEGPKRRSALP